MLNLTNIVLLITINNYDHLNNDNLMRVTVKQLSRETYFVM